MAEFTLKITGLTHDGRGVGRHQGKAVFVSGAVPGDEVSVEPLQEKRKFIEAGLKQIHHPSADRVSPFCEYFGQCGGCQLQHFSPEAQQHWKQQNLLKNLKKSLPLDKTAILPPLTGPTQSYRRRTRFHGVKNKSPRLGFKQAKSRQIIDIVHCPLLTPGLDAAWQDKRAELTPQLTRQPQQWQGVEADNGVFWSDTHHGVPYYTLRGLKLFFSPQSFIQVNGDINEKMVGQALDWLTLTPQDRVLDLFCGIGNFTLSLAQQAGEVVGVEGVSQAVTLARHNAPMNGLKNCNFHVANLFDPIETFAWSQLPYSKVLLDPGREGAQAVCNWLKPKPVEKVVYVSCNPATFSRDAALLANNGWRLDKLQLLDMFPHTYHTEVMGLFIPF